MSISWERAVYYCTVTDLESTLKEATPCIFSRVKKTTSPKVMKVDINIFSEMKSFQSEFDNVASKKLNAFNTRIMALL